jgi:hypothetical protein
VVTKGASKAGDKFVTFQSRAPDWLRHALAITVISILVTMLLYWLSDGSLPEMASPIK